MDSFIEVSKSSVFIYFFELKNAARLKVRYVCTIYCNDGGHVTRIVFVTFKSMFLCISFGYNCFSYFDSYCFS